MGGLFSDEGNATAPTANLSEKARAYLTGLGVAKPDVDAETASLLWMHVLGIGYSPLYLFENADGVREDWPRVPLPDSRETLLASAELGRQVAALLDTEEPVAGVTSGPVRPELRTVGAVSREGGGALDPGAGDLALRAGWGHRGRAGVVMPGRGWAVKRPYTSEERYTIEGGAALLGLSAEEAFARLGDATYDVYLNDRAYWSNVPEEVWGYTIGGYQVMKKWLSYREEPILGRPLSGVEAREVRDMARRIAAIRLLEPLLDANYAAVKRSGLPLGAAG